MCVLILVLQAKLSETLWGQVKKQQITVKFWIWGPITVYKNLTCALCTQFYPKIIPPYCVVFVDVACCDTVSCIPSLHMLAEGRSTNALNPFWYLKVSRGWRSNSFGILYTVQCTVQCTVCSVLYSSFQGGALLLSCMTGCQLNENLLCGDLCRPFAWLVNPHLNGLGHFDCLSHTKLQMYVTGFFAGSSASTRNNLHQHHWC